MVLLPIGSHYRIGARADLPLEGGYFAGRHELEHVLNGDADDWLTPADRRCLTWEERVSDSSALAVPIPGRLIEMLGRARMSWGDITAELEAEIRDR